MEPILLITAATHLFYTPFTKVEESFNLQAMHDILYWRHNVSEYDHQEYPGVVPRSFLGPLFISILSSPFVMLFEALNISKFWTQYIVRIVLAAVVSVAWNNLRRVISKIYHSQVCLWLTVITISQFHFMFYMSRPLPNIMALPLVLYALAHWLSGRVIPFIIFSGMAIIIFRSELTVFLGLLLVYDIIYRRLSIVRVLKIAIPVGVAILASTITVDSFFWRRCLWPEGEVLWYNIVLNKSSNWGTSPFLWYFYSALPRSMGASLLFVPAGVYFERRVRPIVFSSLGFVLIYSLLPHKELRFIIYVIPVLNLATAIACNRLWINRTKSMWHAALAIFAAGHIILNLVLTLFLAVVSGTNYPGGTALTELHRLEANSTNISVHIGNLAAQSGVSRFLQIRDDWRYSKDENLDYLSDDVADFTHLLVEAKTKANTKSWNFLQDKFDIVHFVDCFNSIRIQYNSLLPVRIKMKTCLGILKRKEIAQIRRGENKNDKINAEKNAEQVRQKQPEAFRNVDVQEAIDITPNQNYEIVNAGKDNHFAASETKEINFEELRNLALGKATQKSSKATKLKLRKIIEHHYRAKGVVIENDPLQKLKESQKTVTNTIEEKLGIKQTVRAIVKQEQIKDMIEQIAKMDLTRMCDLNKLTTKDCLKQIIDKLDDADIRYN